jgi:hypothetical protein
VKPGHASTMILTTAASTQVGSYTVHLSATSISARPGASKRHSVRSVRRAVRSTRKTRRTIRLAVKVMPDAAPAPSAGSVPSHIPTWAYDGCGGQGDSASPALVRQWVTFAESNCGTDGTKALSDCHSGGVTYCTAVQYVDANWIYQQGSLPVAADAQENWWLHEPGYTDSSHRISDSAYGGGNVLNQLNPAVDAWFHSYVQTNYNGYDALMMDDSSGSLSNLTWGSGSSTSQEIGSDSQLQAAHDQMAAAMTHTSGQPFLQIDNALSVNDNLSNPFPMLNNSTGVEGVVSEGAPMENGTMIGYYSTMLDEMAKINQTDNDFAVWLSYDNSGSLQARQVQAASLLLGYSPGHTVAWSDLETNSNDLAIWPEEGIVPTDPVQTMSAPGGTSCLAGKGVLCSSGGHNTLQVASGVYRREFAECYNQSVAFGPCAALVNSTGSPVTVQSSWLTQSYSHQITMDGGDVQSGGTVDLSGTSFTPGSTSIPADDAILLSS